MSSRIVGADNFDTTTLYTGDKVWTGTITAQRVYNAVWNDIADFIEVEKDTDFTYGKVIAFKDGIHNTANKKTKKNVVGIVSDTYGFGIGQKHKDTPQVPIAIGGFVLSYTKIYPTGTPLQTDNDGGLIKASILTRLFHPERIIATFYREENNSFWNKKIVVNGRHWVKVK